MSMKEMEKWRELVERWETKTQGHVEYYYMCWGRQQRTKHLEGEPFGVMCREWRMMLGNLSSVIARAYCTAYGYDNVTRRLYSELTMELHRDLNYKKCSKEALRLFPRELRTPRWMGGVKVKISYARMITILDFVESPEFVKARQNIEIARARARAKLKISRNVEA